MAELTPVLHIIVWLVLSRTCMAMFLVCMWWTVLYSASPKLATASPAGYCKGVQGRGFGVEPAKSVHTSGASGAGPRTLNSGSLSYRDRIKDTLLMTHHFFQFQNIHITTVARIRLVSSEQHDVTASQHGEREIRTGRGPCSTDNGGSPCTLRGAAAVRNLYSAHD